MGPLGVVEVDPFADDPFGLRKFGGTIIARIRRPASPNHQLSDIVL